MKVKINLFLLKIVLVVSSVLGLFLDVMYGQQQRAYGEFFSKASKKTEKRLLKAARKQFDYGNYKEAELKYADLLKIDSTNPMYNFEMAQVHFNNYKQPASIPFFERAIKYSKDTIGEAFYFLATAYRLDRQFELAQKHYKAYFDILSRYGSSLLKDEEVQLKADIMREIEMCDNAIKLTSDPVTKITLNGKTRSFRIVPFGNGVNTMYDDYDAVFSTNDSVMYFTSRREESTGGKVDWDDKYFEDIYVSIYRKNGWEQPVSIGHPINTKKHEAVISISRDAKTLYFYRGKKQGTFYYSNWENGRWSKPAILYKKSDINTKAWETSFFGFVVSPNEIYVVSDREGGMGGRDIYVSQRQEDGNWGPLKNLGEPINTQYDEDAPFITADGKLYFSSKGHNSMGGFDIFFSERENGKWLKPKNLGVPLNTPGDDIYFVTSNTSDHAYFSSSSHDADRTKDMDIYKIELCDDVPYTTVNGFVLGVSSGTILVKEKETNREVGVLEIKEGKYSGKIEHGKKYLFTLNFPNINSVSATIEIPSQCITHDIYQEIHFVKPGDSLTIKNAFFDIKSKAGGINYSEYLAKTDKSILENYYEIKVGTTTAIVASSTVTPSTIADIHLPTTISISNILFDYDRSTIKPEFHSELDKLADFLKNTNKKAKVEIAGHTDSKGSEQYNLALSKRRADAVANYLVSKGIKRSRIKTIGHGESKPIASNENPDGSDNPEGRAKNRRTEITILP